MVVPALLNAQTIARVGKPLNLFTLGDSNGSFPYSWPEQLKQALPDASVFNISKSGRTIGFVNNGDSSLNSSMVIEENLQKAAEFTKDRPFDFIILQLGTNDAKAVFAGRQSEVAANLEKLIKQIKNCRYQVISKAKVVIISPPPYGEKAEAQEKYKGGNRRVEEMSKKFEEIAKRNDCLFINGFKTPGLDINSMTPDGLHLDAIGSRKLIEPLVKIVQK